MGIRIVGKTEMHFLHGMGKKFVPVTRQVWRFGKSFLFERQLIAQLFQIRKEILHSLIAIIGSLSQTLGDYALQFSGPIYCKPRQRHRFFNKYCR
ncbi:MAG TPA: hypothetical protein VKN18_22885 [Blastocatellia bacterium]|nr:hypothetical protein [Blastocatellia bacterium]